MKRKVAIVIAIMLLSTSAVFAAAVNGNFAGLPIVKVLINGETLKSDVPGVVLQGRTVLPARAIAESLNAVVLWNSNTMTASIEKPEINMIFVEEIVAEDDGSWTLKRVGSSFDTVGKDKWANIYFEIGPMDKQLYGYRIILKSPEGEILQSSASEENVIDGNGMMGQILMENLTYQKPGNYKFDFQIKYNDKFETVESATVIVE